MPMLTRYIHQTEKEKGVSAFIQAQQHSYVKIIDTKLLEDFQVEENDKSRE